MDDFSEYPGSPTTPCPIRKSPWRTLHIDLSSLPPSKEKNGCVDGSSEYLTQKGEFTPPPELIGCKFLDITEEGSQCDTPRERNPFAWLDVTQEGADDDTPRERVPFKCCEVVEEVAASLQPTSMERDLNKACVVDDSRKSAPCQSPFDYHEESFSLNLNISFVEDGNRKMAAYGPDIADWSIGRKLGSGNFAQVFHAKNQKEGRTDAVKVILKSKLVDEDDWRNVCNEHRALLAIGTHPNITCLNGALQSNLSIYLFLDFASGKELFNFLVHWRRNKYSPMEKQCVARIFSSVALALGHCHHCGIAHRDVKPENIMVQQDFSAKLVDFGLACPRYQLNGKSVGTMPFVAPEFLLDSACDGAPADVWSCGVVLLEMLFGTNALSASLGWDSKKDLPVAECGSQLLEVFSEPADGLSKVQAFVGMDSTFDFDGSDMLERMLHAAWQQRPTAQELARAPWLSQYDLA